MYQIRKTEVFAEVARKFLAYKRETCMYYDTGLFNEDIIIGNYTSNNKEFIRELDAEIDSRLSTGLWWLLISKNDKFETFRQVFKVRSYIIIITYERFKKEKIIRVIDLTITI